MIRSSSRKGYTSPWPPQALDDTQPEGMTGMDIEIILDPNLTPEQVAEIAMAAEKGGVRTLWHGNMHSTWDAFVALVPAAMATSKIRLGTLAISPYEMHPLKIANAILSLNEIAKGRAIVAIGGGGAVMSATSKDGVRLDFRKMRVVRGVREAVEIVKAASSGKLMKGYDGELFSITMPSRRDWLKSEPPKVYTCSDGPQMTRMGARVADGMMFGDLTIHRAAEVMANIARLAHTVGAAVPRTGSAPRRRRGATRQGQFR
jgi:5,10-methylenetetrahydromethanopterin reductase